MSLAPRRREVGPTDYNEFRNWGPPILDEDGVEIPRTSEFQDPEGPMLLMEWNVPGGSPFLISPILQVPTARDYYRKEHHLKAPCYILLVPTKYCPYGHILQHRLAYRLCHYHARINWKPDSGVPWYTMCGDALPQLTFTDIPPSAVKVSNTDCDACMNAPEFLLLQSEYASLKEAYDNLSREACILQYRMEFPRDSEEMAAEFYYDRKAELKEALKQKAIETASLGDPLMISVCHANYFSAKQECLDPGEFLHFYLHKAGPMERMLHPQYPGTDSLDKLIAHRVKTSRDTPYVPQLGIASVPCRLIAGLPPA